MSFKVALCLSGQPRSYKKGYEYHKRNLLDHFDVDVFMHSWNDIGEETKADLVNLYGSDNRKVESSFGLLGEHLLSAIDEFYSRIPNPQFPARNTYRMFYSIRESKPDRMDNYDVIIRSRYDYALNVKLPLQETKVGKIYVPSDRMTPAHDFCADMFAFGTPKVMRSYMDTFYNLKKHYENGVTMIGEDMLAAQLKHHGLIGENMVYVNMANPFPPGKYNGNWHSLIREDFTDWNKLR